ncbi:TrmH family RNA methyltransferase [Lutimonas zeaxanthinifaciens]|uniref:TrmH family RNA methyltransferase n=1 Tax=Lutimonas zeaxanthinifaciens TaxID=3060215 RepID=UPI00265CFE23|nr:TrmH family RNA methyltransferase [Lutimonas sp. YSD2104]WKK67610.1 TrmH family RNA methyltransferase [Lutimonas sp. YSD2104]
MKEISSPNNDLVKDIALLLEKSRVRKKKGLFVIEGLREILLAIQGSYDLEKILYCEEIISSDELDQIIGLREELNFELIKISLRVYQKLAHRKKTEGILAVSKFKSLDLKYIHLNDKPLILVAEASEKPGNIGALLRTADAANLDCVIIANPKTDVYNPNIIRSSVGCLFTNQVATGSTDEIIEFLNRKGINIYAAALNENSILYTNPDYRESSAIIVGTEDKGLSEKWLNESLEKIIIPMEGKIDSLNVSVSAAILIFEAKRQRAQSL